MNRCENPLCVKRQYRWYHDEDFTSGEFNDFTVIPGNTDVSPSVPHIFYSSRSFSRRESVGRLEKIGLYTGRCLHAGLCQRSQCLRRRCQHWHSDPRWQHLWWRTAAVSVRNQQITVLASFGREVYRHEIICGKASMKFLKSTLKRIQILAWFNTIISNYRHISNLMQNTCVNIVVIKSFLISLILFYYTSTRWKFKFLRMKSSVCFNKKPKMLDFFA